MGIAKEKGTMRYVTYITARASYDVSHWNVVIYLNAVNPKWRLDSVRLL